MKSLLCCITAAAAAAAAAATTTTTTTTTKWVTKTTTTSELKVQDLELRVWSLGFGTPATCSSLRLSTVQGFWGGVLSPLL